VQEVGILPIIILGIYFSIYISLSLIAFKRGGRGLAEYLVAKGALGKIPAIFTLISTYTSVYGFVGLTTVFYTWGYDWLVYDTIEYWTVIIPIYCLLAFKLWKLAKIHKYITPGDLIAHRTGSNIPRVVYAIAVLWPLIFHLGIQFVALSATASALTGIPYQTFLVVYIVIATIAVFIGGLRGVAYCDVYNGVVFVSLMGILIGFLVARWGALAPSISNAFQLPIFQRTMPLQYYLTVLFLLAMPWPALIPHLWIRIYAIERRDTITSSILAYGIIWSTFYGIIPYILTIALAAYWPIPPKVTVAEEYVAKFFSELIGPALATLFFLGLLGAGISTADSILQTCTAMFHRDILETIVKPVAKWPENKREFLARCMTIVVILLAAIAAYAPALPIVRIAIAMIWPLYSIAGIPVILMLFWKRVNKYAFTLGVLAGAISQFLFQFVIWPEWPNNPWYLWEGSLATIIAILVTVIVSLITPPPPKSVLESFYRE
jgi:Na+/proline symporter